MRRQETASSLSHGGVPSRPQSAPGPIAPLTLRRAPKSGHLFDSSIGYSPLIVMSAVPKELRRTNSRQSRRPELFSPAPEVLSAFLKGNSFYLRQSEAVDNHLAKFPLNERFKASSGLRDLAGLAGVAFRTLDRGFRERVPVSGETVQRVARALRVPVEEVADLDNPAERRRPGPDPRAKHLSEVLRSGRLRVLATSLPPLWGQEKHPQGVAYDLLRGALRAQGIGLEALVTSETIAAAALANDEWADAIVGVYSNHPRRSELQLVTQLFGMPIVSTTLRGKRPSIPAETLEVALSGRVAVFSGGFAHRELSIWGVPPERTVQLTFPDFVQLGESVLDGGAETSIAYRWAAERAVRLTSNELKVSRVPITHAHYGIWVRRGDQGLADWLIRVIQQEQCKRAGWLVEAGHRTGRCFVPLFPMQARESLTVANARSRSRDKQT